MAALEALTGRVVHQLVSRITRSVLVQCYCALQAAFPKAECIYVIQDNWPVHTHPDVLVALEAQQTRWPWYRPPHWPIEPSAAAVNRWGHLSLPIQIIPLPTYASWCNPSEKLWRKLRQELTHLHPWADDLPTWRAQVERFLKPFAGGSQELLRSVGLGTPN